MSKASARDRLEQALAGLAAWLLGVLLARPPGERSRLPLAGPTSVFEKPRQLGNFRPQVSDLAFETQTVEARCNDHTFTVSHRETFSCASFSEIRDLCGGDR